MKSRSNGHAVRPDRRHASPEVTVLLAGGLQNHRAGRLAEAERIYRQVLAANPRHPGALHLLGVAALDTGQAGRAVELIAQAISIDPRNPAYQLDLGTARWRLGQLDAASAAYRRAIRLQPNYAQAHFNLATIALKLQQFPSAAACLRRAIAVKPDYADAHNSLGAALLQMGQLTEAADSFRRALACRPAFPEALNGLGSIFERMGQAEQMLACYAQAVALKPDYPDARYNLGTALLERSRIEEAIGHLRRVVELDPHHAAALDNLGTAFKQQGGLEQAAACYRQALARQPDHPGAHTNLSLVLLAQGDLAAGWQEYEWRWRTPQLAAARRGFGQPQWRGEPAEGRTLLVHAEQGFGDTLQFCRFASMAAARGLRVILEVQPPLVRLLSRLAGGVQVVGTGTALPDFDLHCPMLSLPLALGTTLATIPAERAYLQADPGQSARWRSRLTAQAGRGPRIGLVWAGNPRTYSPALATVDARRSIPPHQLMPLFDQPGVQFFSLQKDGPPAPAELPLIDYMAEMTDFADTAALVENLDLVIAVDTAVAHLAAALGRPVWLLNRFDSCWRWLQARTDTPWYPTLRLYRQPSPADWTAVIDAVCRDLRGFTSAAGDAPGC